MAEIRKATNLKVGDHFVWATDESREFVCANNEFNSHRLQVLKVITANRCDGGLYVNCKYIDGGSWVYFLTDEVLVAIIRGHGDFHNGVRCNGCGGRYGDHYCGETALKEGITCKSRKSGLWFVPNEAYLRLNHKFPSDDEFFAEIGL